MPVWIDLYLATLVGTDQGGPQTEDPTVKLTSFRTTRFMAAAPAFVPLVAAQPAAGQAPAPAAATSSAEGSDKFQVISVVAERPAGCKARTVQVGAFRDQQIPDVPLTVNVVTCAVIEAQDAQGVHDALGHTAGVSRSQLGALPRLHDAGGCDQSRDQARAG